MLARVAIGTAFGEVGRFDDERVPFVPAAWIAEVQMHPRAEVRLVHAAPNDPDDTVLVDHLVAQRHRDLALGDLVEGAVTSPHHPSGQIAPGSRARVGYQVHSA